jgi:hypothetical protein
MTKTLTSSNRLRLTAAVLLIAVLAGAVALMRGNDAQSSEATPAKNSGPAPTLASASAKAVASAAPSVASSAAAPKVAMGGV